MTVVQDLGLQWLQNAAFGSGLEDRSYNDGMVEILMNLFNEMLTDTMVQVEARAMQHGIPMKFLDDMRVTLKNVLFDNHVDLEAEWSKIKGDLQEGDWFSNLISNAEARALNHGASDEILGFLNQYINYIVYDDENEGRAFKTSMAVAASNVIMKIEDQMRSFGVPEKFIALGNEYVSSEILGTSSRDAKALKMDYIEAVSDVMVNFENQARSMGASDNAVSIFNDWIAKAMFDKDLPEGRSMDSDMMGLFSEFLSSNLVFNTVNEVEGRAMESGLPMELVDFIDRWYQNVAFGKDVGRSIQDDFFQTLLEFFRGDAFQNALNLAESRAMHMGVPELFVRLARDYVNSFMFDSDFTESRSYKEANSLMSMFSSSGDLLANFAENFMNEARSMDSSQMEGLVTMAAQLMKSYAS